MKTISLRPANLYSDFKEIAALFTREQGELVSEPALREDYNVHKERIFCLTVAENERGDLLGFNWATRSRYDPKQAYFYVIVKPEQRRQGIGHLLYENMEQAAQEAGIQHLDVSIQDASPEFRTFAEKCGFSEHAHYIGLTLDLNTFDDRPYAGSIVRLENEGFLFTSMERLGNTEEAQHKLYLLNDSTAMELIIPEDQHYWLSFDEFKKKVCQAEWYLPGGQLIAIHKASGNWAAMSAITRFEGVAHANNLHTGVDKHYHGRGLGLAMLVLALRYARDVLKVSRVNTDEEKKNTRAVNVYRQLGYKEIPGTISMKKSLE